MQHLLEILRKYWGYDEFRPLQREAIEAVARGRDSLVVLPTGGGKSLCFQVPALAMPGLAVVVSPLISLMKDQVDSLTDCGVPAACVNSSLDFDQRRRVADEIRSGRLKLLYLSPERLMTETTLAFLAKTPLSFIAIDEAHCISDWGHDFRPEYRALRELKRHFPALGVHAYTATATERVRDDIARQLGLETPEVLVGSFDRPNLCYRVERRGDRLRQIRSVLERHAGASGIIYCLRKKDVDELSLTLQASGIEALPYHAGMSSEDRRKNQDAFINDRAGIIVATVAFGMGIDKSDVRFVIHAGAPKSLEAYQQESGRAGRDGLEAECCLFHSPADFIMWRNFQNELPPEALEAATANLAGIERFCATVKCRHQAILEHFGQSGHAGACGACDVCLGELKLVDDSLIVAQKIGSCVLRLKERFGGEYTSLVLVGSRDQKIIERGHDRLSTWGILKEHDKRHVRDWVEQMVEQEFLEKWGDDYPMLRVTEAGRRMLRGEGAPQLLKPAERSKRGARAASGRSASRVELDSWQGVDMNLFETLRAWRRQKAAERGVPPYVVFADVSLRDIARRRPSSPAAMLEAHGVGERKMAQYGAEALAIVAQHCREAGVASDVPVVGASGDPARGEAIGRDSARREVAGRENGDRETAHRDPIRFVPEESGRVPEESDCGEPQPVYSAGSRQAAALFAQGSAVDEVVARMQRSPSTVCGYLADFIEREGLLAPMPWVSAETFERIRAAADEIGIERLKPIFEKLGGAIEYDQIRIAVACLKNAAGDYERDAEAWRPAAGLDQNQAE